MASPHVRSNGAAGPRPQLPAFCRSRRPVVMVTASSIANLRLLVIAGPVPPRLSPATVTNHFRPDPSSALNGPVTASPISDR